MRSYGQYCAVAKALDVVGDRWTLLIVRELMLQGGCRYTDLLHGLPGIATNLLAQRLRELERAGVVRREAAPPPVATTLFHLTEAGLELKPVVSQLGRWGTRFMTNPSGDDTFRSHWLAFPVSEFLHDLRPTGPAVEIELRTSGPTDETDEVAVLEVAGGRVDVRVGPAARPDLVLTGAPPVVMGVLTGLLGLPEARRRGLRTHGDVGVLQRLGSRISAGAGSVASTQ
jgi:DNA-binding HxlR family transcriptional regulator